MNKNGQLPGKLVQLKVLKVHQKRKMMTNQMKSKRFTKLLPSPTTLRTQVERGYGESCQL